MTKHEKYIRKCIELARKGEGKVAPNPLVGAVVVDEDGNMISEGYHERYREAHAEINALNRAGGKAKGSTLYLNLEPCCHYGKTPPCIDRVIESGVKRLVVGMSDPNPRVAGNGIRKAREAGIEVIENVLNPECMKLNEIFIKNITGQKPFVAIKTASTMDGKIATSSGKSKWITSEKAREEVHRLRNRYDAVLTGSGTVIADNPSLTCRMEGGRNPARVVMDSNLNTPAGSKVYQDDGIQVTIAVSESVDEAKIKLFPGHVEILRCPVKDNRPDIGYLVQKLYENGINSILVEAGGVLNGAFLKSGIVDKVYFFLAPKIMGDRAGLSSFQGLVCDELSRCTNLRFGDVRSFSPDIMIEAYL